MNPTHNVPKIARIDTYNVGTNEWKLDAMDLPWDTLKGYGGISEVRQEWTPKVLQLEVGIRSTIYQHFTIYINTTFPFQNNFLLYGDYKEKRAYTHLFEYIPDLKKFVLRKETIPNPTKSVKAVIAPEHWCY